MNENFIPDKTEDNSKTGEFEMNDITAKTEENSNASDSAPEDAFIIGGGFNISDEDEFIEEFKEKESKGVKHKKKTARSIVGTFVWIFLIVGVSATIAIGAIFCAIDYIGLHSSKEVTITIEEGESLDSITDELYEKGAVSMPFLFKFYCNQKGYAEQFKPGVHTIRTDRGYSQIVYEFTTVEGQPIKTATVEIPLTADVREIAVILEENEICSQDQFFKVMSEGEFDYDFVKEIPVKSVRYRFEGYLFPDTYEFYAWNSEEGARLAIEKMLSNFDAKFSPEMRERAEELELSIHEVTTLASIIELECTGHNAEMPKVSAIFHNRLYRWGDEKKLLGSSPTAEYLGGLENYDTNITEGIPVGPYCSTGEASLKAALYPTKSFESKYYFFVTDKNAKFYYTQNNYEHNNIIYELQSKGLWAEE